MKKILLTIAITLFPLVVSANGGFLNVYAPANISWTVTYGDGLSQTLTGSTQAFQFPGFEASTTDGTENGGVMLNYSVVVPNAKLTDGCVGSINSMKEKLVNCTIYVQDVTPTVVATGGPVLEPVSAPVIEDQDTINLLLQIIDLLKQLIALKQHNERTRNN